MKILVTNDDGIDSPGLHSLAKAMQSIGEVFIVAPDSQQSAVGHALTIENPLRAYPYHLNGEKLGFAVNGTPSDCVKLAVSSLMDEKPDLVVSGINFGRNTSINIIYSGTVAAATEGMLLGIPSIAFSLDSFSRKSEMETAGYYAGKIVESIMLSVPPKGTLLNVNIPAISKDEVKGVQITQLSKSEWIDKYEKRSDPFGREYFWFSGEYHFEDKDLQTDDFAIKSGYISITPIEFNFINSKFIDTLKKNEMLLNNI
jgi:5'-nucleotidase